MNLLAFLTAFRLLSLIVRDHLDDLELQPLLVELL